MVVEKILKQLTPERIEKEIEAIQKTKLPKELQKWVKEYEKVGERDEFIWKWAYQVSQTITFPGIAKKYHKSLWKTKFLIIMWIVMIDDVADKMRNRKLLKEILKIPVRQGDIKLNKLSREERRYLKLVVEIWGSLKKTIKRYPRYKEFRQIVEYDIEQLLNGIKYACLINENFYLSNPSESRIYLSHNTPAILSYMIDLSCFSKFDIKNLGVIREIGWYAQLMTRIANTISTWEREIKENDITSEVFIRASEDNLLGIGELSDKKEEIIRKIKASEIEEYLLQQWENYYSKVNRLARKIDFINSKEILQVLEKLIILHLISKGLI